MVTTLYQEVIRLIDRLPSVEQTAVKDYLDAISPFDDISDEEFNQLLDSVIIDLGTVPADYSFRREDWYDDNNR
jgi:hypothetical protein